MMGTGKIGNTRGAEIREEWVKRRGKIAGEICEEGRNRGQRGNR
jgi:hypothetical protein